MFCATIIRQWPEIDCACFALPPPPAVLAVPRRGLHHGVASVPDADIQELFRQHEIDVLVLVGHSRWVMMS